MTIREVKAFNRKYDDLSFYIDDTKEMLDDLEKNRHFDDGELGNLKNKLKKFQKEYDEFVKSVVDLPVAAKQIIHFDQNFIAGQLVELMNNITGKNHVYEENFRYSLEHNGIARKKIHTIVDEEYANHGPFIDYYDIDKTPECNSDDEIEDFYNMAEEDKLYVFPDVSTYEFDVFQLSPNGRTEFHAYNDGSAGYSVRYNYKITSFLSALICKALYLGRDLTNEEIEKMRIKFTALVKEDYDLNYYDDSLYNLEDKKIIEKNFNN